MRRDGIGVKGRQNIYLLYSAASNVATLSGIIIVCTQPRLVVKDETYCGHGNHANGIHAEFCGGRSSRPTKETLKPILLQIRSQPGLHLIKEPRRQPKRVPKICPAAKYLGNGKHLDPLVTKTPTLAAPYARSCGLLCLSSVDTRCSAARSSRPA